ALRISSNRHCRRLMPLLPALKQVTTAFARLAAKQLLKNAFRWHLQQAPALSIRKRAQHNRMRRGLRFWVSVIAFVFLLDRICKWLAVTQWSQEQISILPGVDALLLLNPGIAFSIPLTGRFAVALTAIIMAIV